MYLYFLKNKKTLRVKTGNFDIASCNGVCCKTAFHCVNELSTVRSETVQSVLLLTSSSHHSHYFVLLLFSGLFSLSRSFLSFFNSDFPEEFSKNESWREKAVKHHHPGLRLYVYVHCLPDMWQHRGGCVSQSVNHSPSQSINQSMNSWLVTCHHWQKKMPSLKLVLRVHLCSKRSSRASTAPTSMAADTQGSFTHTVYVDRRRHETQPGFFL